MEIIVLFCNEREKMMVDAVWSMYLSYLVRNEVFPDDNLRNLLKDARKLLG